MVPLPLLTHSTRLLAGILVPNTSLINASITLARSSLPDPGFNHVMRSWLNGQAIINHMSPDQRSQVDEEAFGVAALLHDLGWSPTFQTPNHTFEVDGANAARDFLHQYSTSTINRNSPNSHSAWDKHRVQLVWDAITLHSNADVVRFKEIEAQLTAAGTNTEFFGVEAARGVFGPDLITVTQAEWEGIKEAFPRANVTGYVKDLMTHFCTVKPEVTYSNWVGDWGEKYVPGYTLVGHKPIEFIEALPE